MWAVFWGSDFAPGEYGSYVGSLFARRIDSVYTKKDKKWMFFLAWFLVGMAIIVVPVFVWLARGEALGDFFTDYILFNIKYISNETRASILNRYTATTYFLGNSLVLGSLIILVNFVRRKGRDFFLNVVYLSGLAVALIAVAISGMSYPHYGMAIIPLLVYPYAKAYSSKDDAHNSYRLVLSVFLVLLTFGSWQDIGETAVTKYYNFTQGNMGSLLSEEQQEILDLIEKYTEEDDKIMVLGNQNIWYILSKRLAASKYSYQTPIAIVDNSIMNEFLEDMETNKPQLVIMAMTGDYDYESFFPNIQDYELVYSSSDQKTTVYILKSE